MLEKGFICSDFLSWAVGYQFHLGPDAGMWWGGRVWGLAVECNEGPLSPQSTEWGDVGKDENRAQPQELCVEGGK